MIRMDLHTHSEASKDGGLSPEEYAELLQNEILDVIAITDHDRIDFAVGLQKALGSEFIIVGEEITTSQGEIIGLYLTEPIKQGMSAADTVAAIHAQNGLVYIPHPFEKIRKGLTSEILQEIAENIDIMETNNGRALTSKHSISAQTWAVRNKVPAASSSDAHGLAGVGHTYTKLLNRPTRSTLLYELNEAVYVHGKPPIRSLFYPKYNRFVNTLRGQN